MTILSEPRATLRERRFEHFVGDYFGPGGVETHRGMTVFDIDADIDMRPVRE